MSKMEAKTIYPRNIAEWHNWLQENHQEEKAVWVICYKQKASLYLKIPEFGKIWK